MSADGVGAIYFVKERLGNPGSRIFRGDDGTAVSVSALKETSPDRRYIALIRRSQSYWVVDSFVDSGGSQTDN